MIPGDVKLNHDFLQRILISYTINCFQMVINSAPNEFSLLHEFYECIYQYKV